MQSEYVGRADKTAKTHQALGEISRLKLLDLLQACPEGLSAAEGAKAIGLHVATVRTHLEVLFDAGLVERVRDDRVARGRPRVIYRVAPEAEESSGPGYRLLAGMLASLVENSMRDPAAKSEAAGTAWGRSLVERVPPLMRMPRAEAIRRVSNLLDDLGFAPQFAGDSRDPRIMLHRCPFRSVAVDHGSVACSAHLGLIKGALEELGASSNGVRLEPFVTSTLCVAHLGRAPR